MTAFQPMELPPEVEAAGQPRREAFREAGTQALVLRPGLFRKRAFVIEDGKDQLLAVDQRGWGRSRALPGPYTLQQLADDVLATIAEAGIDDYVLVGHSMGGKVAQLVAATRPDVIEVAMPVGLYTSCEISAPCGLCSADGIIGLLDVPDTFLDPRRMRAGLMWFTRGFVEYQFPNNARLSKTDIEAMEFSFEISSEVPGTATDWPSDITVTVNQKDVGTWTSPGDFGDQRGVYTPDWWTLRGSQYGKLKTWRVAKDGTYVDGVKISPVSLKDLDVSTHHSIRLRIGVKANARHPGGVNIFGRGFGNYDQDIVLRIHTAR